MSPTSKKLISSQFRNTVSGLVNNPAHAYLLHSKNGSGSLSAAEFLVDELISVYKLDVDAVFKIDGAHSGIDDIRDLLKIVMLREGTAKQISKIILFRQFDRLSIESQNALLKLLEEPNSGTVFILSSDDLSGILPTIKSRSTVISVGSVSKEDMIKELPEYSKQDIAKALSLARGNTSRAMKYLSGENESLESAKLVLQGSKYQRLLVSAEISNNPELIVDVLSDILSILQHKMHTSINNGISDVGSYTNKMEMIVETQNRLKSNMNPKLALDHLFCSL